MGAELRDLVCQRLHQMLLGLRSADRAQSGRGPRIGVVEQRAQRVDRRHVAEPAEFLDGSPPHRIDYVLLDGDAARYPVLDAHPLFDAPECINGEEVYLSDHVALVVQIGLG